MSVGPISAGKVRTALSNYCPVSGTSKSSVSIVAGCSSDNVSNQSSTKVTLVILHTTFTVMRGSTSTVLHQHGNHVGVAVDGGD